MLNFEVLRLSVYEFIYFIYPPEAVVTKGINKFFAEKECNLEEIQSTGKKLSSYAILSPTWGRNTLLFSFIATPFLLSYRNLVWRASSIISFIWFFYRLNIFWTTFFNVFCSLCNSVQHLLRFMYPEKHICYRLFFVKISTST